MRLHTATMAVLLATSLVQVQGGASTHNYVRDWKNFKAKYSKRYSNVGEEKQRFGYFVENMKIAEEQQKLNPHATFGVNGYADFSAAEAKRYHSGESGFKKAMEQRKVHKPKTVAPVIGATPNTKNWTADGAVTHIKNQGNCGSCYTFSTTGNIEGQWFLAGNTLTSLSEQELVSCDDIDDSCGGGFQDDAFVWLISQRGGVLSTSASYPYVSGHRPYNKEIPACKTTGLVFGANISDFRDIARDEAKMAAQVAHGGPLAVNVDASSWMTYTGGVMSSCSNTAIDHAVLITGFDLTANPPYWIIKNSWGTNWGEDGYLRIQYGVNLCLVGTMPTTAIVGAIPTFAPAPPTPAPPLTPAPTWAPPPPPVPATPSPTFGSTWTQLMCKNSQCTQDCTNKTFPQNTCLQVSGGGSAKGSCDGAQGLRMEQYMSSSDCSGWPLTSYEPVGICGLDHQDYKYVLNICPEGGKAQKGGVSSSEIHHTLTHFPGRKKTNAK